MTPPPYLEIGYNANGTPSRIKAADLGAALSSMPDYKAARSRKDYGEMVFLLMGHYEMFFQLSRPRDHLKIEATQSDALGSTHVRLLQMLGQIPVEGKMAMAHFNKNDELYLYQGDYISSGQLHGVATEPRLTASQASARALEAAASPGSAVQEASLVVFVTESQEPRLAFNIVVARGLMERSGYFVDAMDGRILHTTSLLH